MTAIVDLIFESAAVAETPPVISSLVLGYSNLIDTAALSGGSWLAQLPLANLQSRRLSHVARSTNDDAASTLINIDLGSAKAVRAFGAIQTNLSASGATWRLRGSDDNTFATSLYDSNTLDADIYTPDLIVDLGQTITARYWRVEITDTSNVAGYVQVGRLFLGPALAPASNYSYGAELGYQSRTGVQSSLGGVDYFDVRSGRRLFSFALNWLSDAEAYADALALQRIGDVHGEVLLIADPTDVIYNQQRHFLGRLQQISPIKNPYLGTHQAGFDILEII